MLAWILRILWGYWLALLAFWFPRADALLALQDSLVFVFSGIIAPVNLLPDVLQKIAVFLPFRFMVGFPVKVMTRHLNTAVFTQGLLTQTVWLTIALFLCTRLWQSGLQRYSAIGG